MSEPLLEHWYVRKDQDLYIYPDPCPHNSVVFTDMLLHAIYIISTSIIYEFCFPNAKNFK